MTLGSTAASAQSCGTQGYPQVIGGVVGASNALGAVIDTVNTSFIAQGNAFVGGLPNPAPDQTSGGTWGRVIGGNVATNATGTFNGTIGGAPAQISCNSNVRLGYGGFQLGQDIARLNIGGDGGSVHIGVTGGALEANAQDRGVSNFTGNFEVPFAGLYAAYMNGPFFADLLVRSDFYQTSLTSPDAALQNQRLNGLAGTVSTSAGYRFDLGNNWFVEPSGSFIYSRLTLNTLSLPGGFGNSNNQFFLPPATLSMSPNESILGRLGARVGTSISAQNINWQPFATASVWHEFAGNTTATYDAPVSLNPLSATGVISNSRIQTYGQFSAGVAAQAVGSPLVGYARIDYRTGGNIEAIGFSGGLRYNFDPTSGPLKRVGVFKGPEQPAAAYDWSGFYVGALSGMGWGQNTWNFPAIGTGTSPRNAGALLGGSVGYNQQFGAWVLGVEGDAAATHAKGGAGCINNFANSQYLPSQNCNNDQTWVATTTGKFGYAWDRVMAYGKVGAAFTETKIDVSCNADAKFWGLGCMTAAGYAAQNLATTTSQAGWTVGAGFELALTSAWSAKAEYDYMNFGSRNVVLPDASVVNFKQAFNQVKFGLNYHFNHEDAVATAPAAAPVDWTGPYLGVAVADRLSSARWETPSLVAGAIPPDPTTTPASFYSANAQARLSVGYDLQASSQWVVGIVGDVGNGDSKMTRAGIPGAFGNGDNATYIYLRGIEAEGADSTSVKLGWDGAFRGKVGVLVTPAVLVYGTGGAAFQQVSVSANCNGSPASWCVGGPRTQTFTSVRLGWTAGLGVEALLTGNWVGKAEARYADYGNYANKFFAGTTDEVTSSVRPQTLTGLIGVSYKFGTEPAAVVAKY
ncbi:outer membrane beta-barrel protein [Rhodoblastus acidophilus]|uniref:outer membrane beta-barrel protein n=1 Tax=Rhodoblastus acidophilus TaxID=1074 RepID=UPI0022255572|nr:autotransporter domain-containing protein [Rhodoblastus acidophilus]